MAFFSALRFQSMTLWSQKNSWILLIAFLLYGMSSFLTYGTESSLFGGIYAVFYTPRIPLLDLFRALLFMLPFILICTHERRTNHYILLRLKSTKIYVNSLLMAMILYVFFFVFMSYMIIAALLFISHQVGTIQSSSNFIMINGSALIQQYVFISLSIIAFVLINYLLILVVKKAEIATCILIVLFASTYYFLAKHPYLWIALISCLFLYTICYWFMQRKNDVFS